jgi:hypothetical protein
MLLAEKKTRKLKTTSWSPTFGKAIAHKTLWKIALSLKINHNYPNEDFVRWALSLGVNDIRSMDIATIKRNYRIAQKELREIERSAENLRETHLRSMLTEAELSGDDKKKYKNDSKFLYGHTKENNIFNASRMFLSHRQQADVIYPSPSKLHHRRLSLRSGEN